MFDPAKLVRCLGPGPEHTFRPEFRGERLCPACRKRRRLHYEPPGHYCRDEGAARGGRVVQPREPY